jgi:hypothetical protein
MLNGGELRQKRVDNKLPIFIIGDEVNYINNGLFTILDIDWYNWRVQIHTRGKSVFHTMYRNFWCSIDEVTLSGTFHNNRMTNIFFKN